MEQELHELIAGIVNTSAFGVTTKLSYVGLTSISAIKLAVQVNKRYGVTLDSKALVKNGTLQSIENEIWKNVMAGGGIAGENLKSASQESGISNPLQQKMNQPSPMDDSEYAAFIPVLDKNTLNAFRNGERQPIGDVLLTGATGYLGIHVLNELLTNYDGHIICPLRSKSDQSPMQRLKTLYFYYFGRTEAFAHIDERVETISAEVTQPDALDAIDRQGLTVINCVANVKHFSAGNDIEMVNIESVRNLIGFCLRTHSRLIHISTISVAGMSINDVPGPDVKLTERDFYIGQYVNDRKYTYSKFKAEELVLDAIAHHGLNAKIMRVGNLSARQKDGEFQINFNTNNFLAMLRAYVVIGMVPYEALNQRFEFSPIDEVAHAIMLLAQTPKDCTVFHPNNTHRQFLSDVLIGFAKAGIVLKRVESEEFQQALDRMMDNPDLITLLRPLMAYNLGGNRKVRSIESTNDYTTQVLYRCGFQWPPAAADYVHRFVDTIIGFDYFNVSR